MFTISKQHMIMDKEDNTSKIIQNVIICFFYCTSKRYTLWKKRGGIATASGLRNHYGATGAYLTAMVIWYTVLSIITHYRWSCWRHCLVLTARYANMIVNITSKNSCIWHAVDKNGTTTLQFTFCCALFLHGKETTKYFSISKNSMST